MLLREGDDATEDTEVEGDGGFVLKVLELSLVVTTLGGFLALWDMLRLCGRPIWAGSDRAATIGVI